MRHKTEAKTELSSGPTNDLRSGLEFTTNLREHCNLAIINLVHC